MVHANGWSISRFRKYSSLGGLGVKVYKDAVYREDFEKGEVQAPPDNVVPIPGAGDAPPSPGRPAQCDAESLAKSANRFSR